MAKIILFIFIAVFGVLIYKLAKPLLNKENPADKYKPAGVQTFTELKEELEFKIAFYKKKVEDGHQEASQKLKHYEQELEEINTFLKFNK